MNAVKRTAIALAFVSALPAGPPQAAPLGAAPVNAPFLSYTGRYDAATIVPVMTTPLAFTGRQAPPLPAVTTTALHYSGRTPLPAITTPPLMYTGRGDPKGLAPIATSPLVYKGKQ